VTWPPFIIAVHPERGRKLHRNQEEPSFNLGTAAAAVGTAVADVKLKAVRMMGSIAVLHTVH